MTSLVAKTAAEQYRPIVVKAISAKQYLREAGAQEGLHVNAMQHAQSFLSEILELSTYYTFL